MATETTTLELAYVETSEDYRDTAEFLINQTVFSEGHARLAEAWRKGSTSLCRYGRIALNAVGGEVTSVSDTDAALNKAFDRKVAHLYQIQKADNVVGIGSIILGQKIIDSQGQSGPRANLEYYIDSDSSDDMHYEAAGLLLEQLLDMSPPSKKLWFRQKELKNVSMKYYRRSHNNSTNLLIRAMSGFAAVPVASDGSSRGFADHPSYASTKDTLVLETVYGPDVYDVTYNNSSIKLYEPN